MRRHTRPPIEGSIQRYLFFLPLDFAEAEIKPSFATHHSKPTDFFHLHSPCLALLSSQRKFDDGLHNALLFHTIFALISPKSLSLQSIRNQCTSLMSPRAVGGTEAPVYISPTLPLTQRLRQGG